MAMTGGGAGAAERQRPRFPALDPEPPRRSASVRLAWAGAVVLVVAAIIAGVLVASGGGRPAGEQALATSAPLPGHLLVVNPAGVLAVADTSGQEVAAFPRLGQVDLDSRPIPDASGTEAVTAEGQVIRVVGGAPTLTSVAPDRLLTNATAVAGFADRGQDLVLVDEPYGSSSTVVLAPLAGGPPISLGVGDAGAGDPQAPGALVVVAAADYTSNTPIVAEPDIDVELRDAGSNPVTLATASQLTDQLDVPAGQPLLLGAFPSPSGDAVAIAAEPDAGDNSPARNGGILVVNRAGGRLMTVPWGLGPTSHGPDVSWSPDGTSFGFVTSTSQGEAMSLVTLTGPTTTEPVPSNLPGNSSQIDSTGPCRWSPSGAALLCYAQLGQAQPGNDLWLIGLRNGGAVTAVKGAGEPILWPPSGGGDQ